MFDSLPVNARGMLDWSWAQFEPYYLDLATRNVRTGGIERFLADWTRLSELVDETHSRLYVATSINTADTEAEKRYHAFLEEIYPNAEEQEQRLRQKLVDRSHIPHGMEIPILKMRTDAELFREENLPLKTDEQKLCLEYDKIVGAQTVQWDGKEVTVVQLRPVYQKPDRSLREKAWRLASQRQLDDREAIADLWRRFMDLRGRMAAHAGYDDYRSFRWKELHRFDYTPDDCMKFHRAIEEVVVPAAQRIAEKRRAMLGVESLRPWDTEVDPLGRGALTPFDKVSRLQEGVASIFHRVDQRLGSYFDTMIREELLDLDNRKNKAPGGYCTDFAAVKRPFIFMNAVGIHDDVQTLLHEAGHSFHTFEKSSLPYYQQRQVGMEFSEVASMAMELLASPYLAKDQGGFYEQADAARAVIEHLEWGIRFWPYMAVVDAFQQWVYEHPSESVDPERCDEQWARMWNRFITWIDWTGLERELRNGWQTKLHILVAPLYYVEYGLAQLGAAQIWANALKDQAGAVAAYRSALALGGTASIPELFAAAGAQFAFDTETLGEAVSLMMHTIESQ